MSAMQTTIDLQLFCADDAIQTRLATPFSRGDWTYATDGHIAVRVPRRPDVPDRDDAPDVERVFAATGYDPLKARLIQPTTLPPPEIVTCWRCIGGGVHRRGRKRKVTCEECNGAGTTRADEAVRIGDRLCARQCAERLAFLPDLHMDSSDLILAFRFAGGEALVSPLLAATSRRIVGAFNVAGAPE